MAIRTWRVPVVVAAALVLVMAGSRTAATPFRGFQIGADFGLESGPYRGYGTGPGFGIEAGWNVNDRRGLFASLNIGGSNRGDADPIFWVAVEGRFRFIPRESSGSAMPYASVGIGAGLVSYPLFLPDAALVTVPIEVGLMLGRPDGLAPTLAIRERPIVTIGDGDPAFSFLNRIGLALMIRF